MADSTQTTADKGALVRFFGAVERMGQRLPDPLTLFWNGGTRSPRLGALRRCLGRGCAAKR